MNLLAVSKGHHQDSINKLFGFGQLDFGESRVQEALPKINELNDLNQLRWHFVGSLQRNKVRAVVKENRCIFRGFNVGKCNELVRVHSPVVASVERMDQITINNLNRR